MARQTTHHRDSDAGISAIIDRPLTPQHAPRMECVRGTCVAIDGSGVLLRGPSGAGKSDLALRLLATGGRLVADDYTCLERGSSGSLRASSPESLAGLLEVHGIGIIRVEAQADAPLIAVIDLVPQADVERLPTFEEEQVLGVTLARFQLTAFESSAAAKVRLVAEIARGNVSRLT